ncbi:MAG: ABC transporter ATP-binding protein [Burkholderiales bacterium]
MSAITLDKVGKTYTDGKKKALLALQEISLSVLQGEAFGFVGPNGAGKSTTIKVLMNIINADGGDARLFDVPVTDHVARKGVSYVPENLYLYDYLTPLEMLLMGTRMHGLPETGLKEHCMQVLEKFSISHVANKRIRQFSKGMTQRTALAHALACKPKLLILDEPLSGLDPIGRKQVVEILTEYRNNGGTIFFSSHVLNDVERLGDRFGIIYRGKLRTVSTPSELVHHDQAPFAVRYEGSQGIDGAEQEKAGRWKLQTSAEKLWSVLDAVKNAGHQIIDVKRDEPTLEQAFMKFISDMDKKEGIDSRFSTD